MFGRFESLLSGSWLGYIFDYAVSLIAAFVEHDYDAVLVTDCLPEAGVDTLAPVPVTTVDDLPHAGI